MQASSPLTPATASPRRWAALAVLTLAIALLAIDGTVLLLAVPSLAADLGTTASQVLWIGDIYSLAIAGLLVTMGALADRLGRKRVLLVGAAAFGAASVLAAFAPSAEVLILARLLLGIAGASLMPSTLAIIRTLFEDPRERTRAIAIWAAAAGGGAAIGPLVGGVLLEHFWWGAVFLINVPVMIVLVVAGAVMLPESRDPRPGPFDPLSAALSILTLVPLVYAVKHLVVDGPGVSVAVAAVMGAAAGAWFVARQRRSASPLIDVALFARADFSGAVASNFIAVFALTGLLFFLSQYLQLVRGLGPLHAGLAELPAALASMAAIAVVGWLVARAGRGRAIAIALAATSGGLLAVAFAEGASSLVWLLVALVPIGLGVGLAQTLTTDAVVSAVPARKAGAASAISEVSYELGVGLGIAVLGSLMTALYRAGVTVPSGASGAESDALRDSLASASATGAPDVIDAAREAFVAAMQATSVVAAILTAIGAVVAWRTIRPAPTDDVTEADQPEDSEPSASIDARMSAS